LGIDTQRIQLKLAHFLDQVLDVSLRQIHHQAEHGQLTEFMDVEGKLSYRKVKAVDPRLLGEAGRGAIRFAEFAGLMERAPSVETNVFNAGAFAQLIGGPAPALEPQAQVVEVEAIPNSAGD
jgi:hypothetical protein